MCVAEMSHRGKEFMAIAAEAEADLRALLAVPSNYKILFLQGGASMQFAMVPMNLLRGQEVADYINTGSWSKKAIAEARHFGKPNVAATTEAEKLHPRPGPGRAEARRRRGLCALHA
jgi:phosphoserine aminotransferase